MTLTLATATAAEGGPTTGKWLLAAIALVWLAGYLVACAIWPFKACRKCDGTGRIRSPGKKAWRMCRRCKGTTARLRVGRRLWTLIARTHKKAGRR